MKPNPKPKKEILWDILAVVLFGAVIIVFNFI